MRVVLFSYHYLESTHRAGFHHLAHAYHDLGSEVVFVTAPLSRVSRLIRDPRLRYPVLSEANALKVVAERLSSYVLYSHTHPADLGLKALNRLSGQFLVRRYRHTSFGELEPELTRADLVIFESTPAIVLAPEARRVAERARFVYRVSDDLETLGVHPAVLDAELQALPLFDHVSCASRLSAEKLGNVRETAWQPHGVAKNLFEAECESPYAGGSVNAVWVGRCLLDKEFLDIAAERLPDWRFHVIGTAAGLVPRSNIILHGELPYEATIGFISHADVGLANYGEFSGLIPGYLAHSLKIVQYANAGIPIVAPDALAGERPHMFCYRPGSGDSIERALKSAYAAGKNDALAQTIPSWHELAEALAGAAL